MATDGAQSDLNDYPVFTLEVKVSQFSGYSNTYTEGIMEDIETSIRQKLDDSIGFLNDKLKRNYKITRNEP